MSGKEKDKAKRILIMTTPMGVQTLNEQNRPLSLKECLFTIIVIIIPIVNVILYLYWSFGRGVNVNRQNFCRAFIIIAAIFTAMGVVFYIVLSAVGMFGDPFDAALHERIDRILSDIYLL